MLTIDKQKILNNLSLKCIALLFGYAFWNMMSQQQPTTATFTVPISFYNDEKMLFDAQDEIKVKLSGTHKELMKILRTLSLHIDARPFVNGSHTIEVAAQTLLLPDTIKLIHSDPRTITVTVHEKQMA